MLPGQAGCAVGNTLSALGAEFPAPLGWPGKNGGTDYGGLPREVGGSGGIGS